MSFIIIALAGVLLFWLFYSQSNAAYNQAKKSTIEKLKNKNLDENDKRQTENHLSQIIQNKPKLSYPIILLFALTLLPLSFYFYYQMGTPNIEELLSQEQTKAPQMSMEEAVAKLEARYKENPNDIDTIMFYARTQFSIKNYDKAVAALRKANELVPNESTILTELAESIAMYNNNRSFLGEPETLISQAVEIDSQNQKALWLYGMIHYEKGDLVKTNEIWTQLYDLMQDESAKSQLLEQLNNVRNQLGMALETNSNSALSPSSNSLISATINVDNSLLNKLDNKPAVLYVYTKASNGMPMPIAVSRHSLQQINKSFPINITLNDENSLQSSRKLSSFESVIIGARISFSGNATPQAGDFESNELEVKIPSSEIIEITIDSIKN